MCRRNPWRGFDAHSKARFSRKTAWNELKFYLREHLFKPDDGNFLFVRACRQNVSRALETQKYVIFVLARDFLLSDTLTVCMRVQSRPTSSVRTVVTNLVNSQSSGKNAQTNLALSKGKQMCVMSTVRRLGPFCTCSRKDLL